MAAPTLSDYFKRKALQVENTQTLLSYYGELYQYYSDKLPINKYMNYLEENIFKEGFTTSPPGNKKFLSLRPEQISLLYPYVRVYKKFRTSNGKTKKIEFPFENKTDLSSLSDPQKYIGEDFPFVSQRFNGPIALLKGIGIEVGGINNRGATFKDTDYVRVNFNLFFQDAKMLFKNWGTAQEPIRYKDLFATPPIADFSSYYSIVVEIGYNVPDGADEDLKIASQTKAVYELIASGAASNLNYSENGELELQFTLNGKIETNHNSINLLDGKYYKKVKEQNNMLVLPADDDAKTAIESYEKEIKKLVRLQQDIKSDLEKPKKKPNKKKEQKLQTSLGTITENIKQRRALVQLAKGVGAAPASFSFITALYEAGLIRYFELDNETYKDYVKKIAKGEPVDVTEINYLPKRKQKSRLAPEDFLKKNPETSVYFTNTLKVKAFNAGTEDSSDAEKIKFFYFGDLIAVMLNDKKGTGVGQDLNALEGEDFSFLFGPIMWIKDNKTKILYNILNTPISLDMFLFELNKEIYQKNLKIMTLEYFFSVFMKRFFDIVIFGYEKAVSGQQNQSYFPGIPYVFDKDKFNLGNQFKRKLYDYVTTSDTRDIINVSLITAMPEEQIITPQTAKKRNLPIIYLGGPDKGPLKRINYSISPLPLQAEKYFSKLMGGAANVDAAGKTIGESINDSIIASQTTAARIELVGSVYFKPGDFIVIDSRFVDGGFFTQEANLLYTTGMFAIDSVSHRIDPYGGWITTLNAQWKAFAGEIEDSYKAYSGKLPNDQNVDIGTQANLERQDIIDTANYNSTVDKQNKQNYNNTVPQESENSKIGAPLYVKK